jgi:hypothetical protein
MSASGAPAGLFDCRDAYVRAVEELATLICSIARAFRIG